MARLEAFRGTTYDRGRVSADDVISPPYDVVGPVERAALAARSPYNAIHVESPVVPPDSAEDAYEHAAILWSKWHDAGIVHVAAVPAVYPYRMTFAAEDGAIRTTTGVMVALGLDPQHTGQVLPHEQTTPKDRHDRLSLLRAARINSSPIWVLSLSTGLTKAIEVAVDAAEGGPWRATDDDGVTHEIWTVTDPAAIDAVVSLAGAQPVLVADGHHRYATACAYFEGQPDQLGADAILALVVELSDHELAVGAIHRLVRGPGPERLLGDLERWFEVLDGPSDPIALRDAMVVEETLGWLGPSSTKLLRPRPALLESASDDLDTSRLAFALEDLGYADVVYQPGAIEAKRAVDDGLAEAAILVRPVTVEQIARTAHGGRLMPPKSTFFHPKPRTGMVFRELSPPAP